jgi:hypothetical protein
MRISKKKILFRYLYFCISIAVAVIARATNSKHRSRKKRKKKFFQDFSIKFFIQAIKAKIISDIPRTRFIDERKNYLRKKLL